MFHMSLDVPPDLTSGPVPAELTDDDFDTLVIEGCQLLGEAGCRFRMGGFGQDDWGLDVSYDLSTVVEQLPDVLVALRHDAEVELDLYAQGVERTVTFTPDGEYVNLRCRSQTSWTPRPDTERLARGQVVATLEKLAVDFAAALAIVAPKLAGYEPLVRWRRGEV
jgi:hypothetical protein